MVGAVDLVPVGVAVVVVVFVVVVVVLVDGAVFVFVLVAGALVMALLGASFSCGLAALSALARARFAARAESLVSEPCFAASPLQAASVNVAIAKDAAVRRIYFTIGDSSLEEKNLPSPLAAVARGPEKGGDSRRSTIPRELSRSNA
jgi:hypothetical protein